MIKLMGQCNHHHAQQQCLQHPMLGELLHFTMNPMEATTNISQLCRYSVQCPMGFIYSIQICEISHQTFGSSHQKCLMCPMIFMNTAGRDFTTPLIALVSLWNYPLVIVTGSHWCWIRWCLGVVSSNKPFPDLMLTQIYVAIWRHKATMCQRQ